MTQQRALVVPLVYSTYWLLHVSAVVCRHQGASWIHLSYFNVWLCGRSVMVLSVGLPSWGAQQTGP
jgi:hypothetical protein